MRKKIFFLAALIWTAIVLYLCLIRSNNIPKISIANFDKYVHAFFHFVFAILWFLFLKIHFYKYKRKKLSIILFLSSLCFGAAIEIMQELFTTTRTADVLDVLANCTGALLAIVAISIIDKEKFSEIV